MSLACIGKLTETNVVQQISGQLDLSAVAFELTKIAKAEKFLHVSPDGAVKSLSPNLPEAHLPHPSAVSVRDGLKWAYSVNQVLDWSIALSADRHDCPKIRVREALVQPVVDRASRDLKFL